MQMAFCDLIGGLILNDFRVTSCLKNFSKNINWFFDTAFDHYFVCSVAPEDVQFPLILSCWCSIDLVITLFFVSPLYTDPHEHFNFITTKKLATLFQKTYILK